MMKFTLTITDATHDEISKFFTGGIVPANSIKSLLKTENEPEAFIPTFGNNTVSPNVNGVGLTPVTSDEENEPVNTNAPAFDSSSMPWDERIHSANRGTNANGTWRKRRGVSDGLVAGVEAELRARVAPAPLPVEMAPVHVMQPEQFQQQQPVAPMTMPPIPEFLQRQPNPVAVQVMQPEQFQQQQPVAPTLHPAPAHVVDFMAFMTTLAQKSSHGVIDHPYIMSLTARTGAALGRQMNAITDINNDQNAINTAIAIMQQEGKW